MNKSHFPTIKKKGKLCLVASRDGNQGSVTIHQDVNIYVTQLDSGEKVSFTIPPGRHCWIQVVRGEGELNGKLLHTGDAAGVSDEKKLEIQGRKAELLLFDLA